MENKGRFFYIETRTKNREVISSRIYPSDSKKILNGEDISTLTKKSMATEEILNVLGYQPQNIKKLIIESTLEGFTVCGDIDKKDPSYQSVEIVF